MPNIDLAVIELDPEGRATAVANVVLSQDYPGGQPLTVDLADGPAGSYGVSQVRWREWDIDRYNGGTFSQEDGHQLTQKGWTTNPPLTDDDDIVPGRESEATGFMAPYPASLFKIIVAFRIMRLVDLGQLSLDETYTYLPVSSFRVQGARLDQPLERPAEGSAVAAEAVAVAAAGETRTIRDWMDPMITVSSNNATRALLKLLHDRDDLPAMHAELEGLGLGTLQVNGTKTGLTFNYGANAGIVRSLPGEPPRRYVISFISSLGYRYTDPPFATRSSYPCYDAVGGICYTQRIPAMAKQLDDYIKSTP